MRKTIAALFVWAVLIMAAGPVAADPVYIVYDPGGSQDSIQAAMTTLGFSYVVRNAANPVTAADLSSGTYAAVIVGWSAGGYDMSGLDPTVLAAGITGNMILTGHDADFHTVYGSSAAIRDAAGTFLERAVLYAGGSPGNPGLLAIPVFATNPFSYLPSAWGIAATDGLAEETITGITAAGNASGLYTGLSLADLSNWGNSYHAYFTAYPGLSVFETGSYGGGVDVTVGKIVTPITVPDPASTLLLFGCALAGLSAFARRRRL